MFLPNVILLVLTYSTTATGQGCISTLTASSGVIQSPGYPVDYPRDISCSWHILGTSNFVVELSIEAFSIEETEGCQRASLLVYDGTNTQSPVLLPPSCGDRISWPSHPTKVLSTGQAMTVQFIASASERFNETGFRATYRRVSPREEVFFAVDATNNIIYRQNRFDVNSERVGVDGLLNAITVDYDPVDQKVYFSDGATKHIGRCDVDGGNQETIATILVDTPDGLAVDPVSRLVYWTDASSINPMISVARLDGSHRRILFDDVELPRDIVIHNAEGTIYWSDWGTFPKIERARGDGTSREWIVTSGLGWPNGISLDIAGGKLYWADAQLNRIERSNLDGSGRTVLRAFSADVHPFGLIFRDDALFWTDWATQGIDVADSDLQEDPTTLIVAGVPTRFHGLAFYSSDDPPIDVMDCSLGGRNSGCEELCVSLPSGASCLAVAPVFDYCPEDITVVSNQVEVVEWREPIATSPSNVDVRLSGSHPGTSLSVAPNDGTITVTYTASDNLGNTVQCTFDIIATYDTTPPNATCPSDIREEMSPSEDSLRVTWREPEATDDSGQVTLLSQSHRSGDLFGPGRTTVTYRYQDVVGNVAECSFQLEVVVGLAPTTVTPTEAPTVPPTVTPAATSRNVALDSMLLMVISVVAVVVIILLVVVSCIIGKCVTCQCKACKKDEQPAPGSVGMVTLASYPPPNIKLEHPAAPPAAPAYATHLASPPIHVSSPPGQYGRHIRPSTIYQEIDPPIYSQNLPPNETPAYDRGISNGSYLEVEGDQVRPDAEPPAYTSHDSRDLDGAGYLQLEDSSAAPSRYISMVGDARS